MEWIPGNIDRALSAQATCPQAWHYSWVKSASNYIEDTCTVSQEVLIVGVLVKANLRGDYYHTARIQMEVSVDLIGSG